MTCRNGSIYRTSDKKFGLKIGTKNKVIIMDGIQIWKKLLHWKEYPIAIL